MSLWQVSSLFSVSGLIVIISCLVKKLFVSVYDTLFPTDILKKYNPDIKGFSVGRGDVDSANAHLNVANPGDQARWVDGWMD